VHGTQTRHHHGRIARIDSIGDRRLSVTFDDGLLGRFVEYTDAVVMPERGTETTVPTPTRLQRQARPGNTSRGYQTPLETYGPSVQDAEHVQRAFDGTATRQHVSVPPVLARHSRRSFTQQMERRNARDAVWCRPDGPNMAVHHMGTQESEHLDDDYSCLL
jgi:hypothetical protein